MSLDIKALLKLAKLMRAEGITHVKTPDLEMSVDTTHAIVPRGTSKKVTKAVDNSPVVTEQTFTDEEILMWSAPGLAADALAEGGSA